MITEYYKKNLNIKTALLRKIFFGSTEINVALTTLVYKYVWVDEKHADQWEKLPEAWSKIVNRKFTLQKGNIFVEFFGCVGWPNEMFSPNNACNVSFGFFNDLC